MVLNDLVCSYLRCRSADLVEVHSNFRLTGYYSMRQAQQCRYFARSLPPNYRHSRLTVVRRGCKTLRNVGIHGEAMYTALTLRSACSYSSCKLPMLGVEGGSPRPFSWECKGDILFREREYPPFPRPPHGVGDNRVRPAGAKKEAPFRVLLFYSTVTDFARLRGLSISHPRWSAI